MIQRLLIALSPFLILIPFFFIYKYASYPVDVWMTKKHGFRGLEPDRVSRTLVTIMLICALITLIGVLIFIANVINWIITGKFF